jgi:hypothetical protein
LRFDRWNLDTGKSLLVPATNAMLGIAENQGIRAGARTLMGKWQIPLLQCPMKKQ